MRARVADRRDGRDERERDRDDFVAGTDAWPRSSARCSALVPELTANRLGGLAVTGELALEGSDLLAEDELRAVEHAQPTAVSISRLDAAASRLQDRGEESSKTGPAGLRHPVAVAGRSRLTRM